jgi:hypothetical protein
MILVMKKSCMGIMTKGSIISTSSSYPGLNIIPHYRFSYRSYKDKVSYLNSKSVKLRDYDYKYSRYDKCNGVKKANKFLKSVDWIFYDLLDQNSKPQCVEL